jgi:hypothetical protein
VLVTWNFRAERGSKGEKSEVRAHSFIW